MPFKSESQRRLFWAKVNRGEISKAKAEEWERETPKKKLPERIHKKKASALTKEETIEQIQGKLAKSKREVLLDQIDRAFERGSMR